MTIDLSAKKLTLSLRVHAHTDLLMPLPVPIKQWMPTKITIDGQQTTGLIRKNNSTLWLHNKQGSHLVKISGRVDYLNQLKFDFLLRPHHINLHVKGWSVEGMDDAKQSVSALNFSRLVDKNTLSPAKEMQQKEMPVYVEITRSIELGLDWYVTTHIRAISGTAYPVILNIPLLLGESVITDNIKVKDRHAVITLNSNNRSLSWTSRLHNKYKIDLHASKQSNMIEKWILNASPIWHIDYKGIPVIYHQRHGNNWQPEWRPWPGVKTGYRNKSPKRC